MHTACAPHFGQKNIFSHFPRMYSTKLKWSLVAPHKIFQKINVYPSRNRGCDRMVSLGRNPTRAINFSCLRCFMCKFFSNKILSTCPGVRVLKQHQNMVTVLKGAKCTFWLKIGKNSLIWRHYDVSYPNEANF